MTRKKKPLHQLSTFDKLLNTFKQLSEPVQVILIIGFLLLIAWIVSNPDVLRGLIRVIQLWLAIKGSFSYLKR